MSKSETDQPQSPSIVFTDRLGDTSTRGLEKFVAHALCVEGSATFSYNGNDFTLSQGDLLVAHRPANIDNLTTSEDFKVRTVYIEDSFCEKATPNLNYGIRGSLALFLNPVMCLTECEQEVITEDMDLLEWRLEATCYRFYEESLRCAVQLMILDLFSFHAYQHNWQSVSNQNARIINGFFRMLDDGRYRENREVSYYAAELCVTPKYLSEICKKVSGHSANFWINRYTTLEIARLLRNPELTLAEITDMLHFSSSAYFSRYVQAKLGVSPSKYRN